MCFKTEMWGSPYSISTLSVNMLDVLKYNEKHTKYFVNSNRIKFDDLFYHKIVVDKIVNLKLILKKLIFTIKL